MKRSALLLIAAAVLFSGRPAQAHHPLADYRQGESQTIKGTIAEFVLRNPHSFVYLDVPDAGGVPQRWTLEWIAALPLMRQGVTGLKLKSGDAVVVTGLPARNGEHRMWLRTMTKPADGWSWTGSFE